jgi:hypothetical protein
VLAGAEGAAAGAGDVLAGLLVAGEDTGGDFGAHATTSNTTATDAKTNDLMNALRSLEEKEQASLLVALPVGAMSRITVPGH